MKSEKNNTNDVNSNWERKKKKMQEQFPQLTDQDFLFENGDYFKMFKHIQTKLGFDKAAMTQMLTSL